MKKRDDRDALERRLAACRIAMANEAREEKIKETVEQAKEAFVTSEADSLFSHGEFLLAQLKWMRKRWWLLQLMILLLMWAAMVSVQDQQYIQRGMGVAASIFVILVIPELWKNRRYMSMEIEAASYYSLRQVYAARMLLFGLTDVVLLTAFCGTAAVALDYQLYRLMTQFLFPVTVTACICFGTLGSRRVCSEALTLILCVIWSSVWMVLTLDERIYRRISLPVWAALLAAALIFLIFAICRIIVKCDRYWEVSFDGIEG